MEKDPGLNQEEVQRRIKAGQRNKAVKAPSKTLKQIIVENVFTYFNLVFLLIALALIGVGALRDLTFLPIIIANTVIGIVQEWRAKAVLDKLTMLNAPKAKVRRGGKVQEILAEDLVLDDVALFSAGAQIPADAVVIAGEIRANEALLTGEADEIKKAIGAELLSGSFVVSGECEARLTKVGVNSYISQLTLQAKAMKNEEQSEILRSLNKIVRLAGIAIIPIAILIFLQQFWWGEASLKATVQAATAAIIGMIPEGLFLLASMTLAISAMRLALGKVLTHDMKSIETLARVNVLCVDKTGTITDEEMEVSQVVKLSDFKGGADALNSLLGDFVNAQKADNQTMTVLKKHFNNCGGKRVKSVVGFSSAHKYSGVEFENGAVVLGAPEFVLREDFAKLSKKIEQFSGQGYRVLLLGGYDGHLKGGALQEAVQPWALVLLANKVRESAPNTFRYFAEQGVAVKVISGDNHLAVAEIARQAGIEGESVDASTLTEKELVRAMQKYTIFGRVRPEQKRLMVEALKQAGKTVAMVGDGVNDVLALKAADCGVAMASGAQAAAQVAQLVLLESDFAKMPMVVIEGRRVVNNLERSGSLFLVKNVFSLLLVLLALGAGMIYPLVPAQISLVSAFTIGVPAFFLSQMPSEELIRGNFVKNVLRRAVPGGLANVILVGFVMLFGAWSELSSAEIATSATIALLALGMSYLWRISQPMDKYRQMIFWGCLAGIVVSLLFLDKLFAISHQMSLWALALSTFVALLAPGVLALMVKWTGRVEQAWVSWWARLPGHEA